MQKSRPNERRRYDNMKYKICIWGLGQTYRSLVNTLKYFEKEGMIEIIALTANEVPDDDSLDGWRIVSKEDLKEIFFDYVVVMNKTFFEEIVGDIKRYTHAGRKSIIPFRVLRIPHLNFEAYIRLKNSDLCIVSNSCWGGIAYHTLGLECISPFKNLFIEDHDYIKLLRMLDYYMGCVPTFYKMCKDTYSETEYPILLLDDIKIHCNHSSNPDQAIADWIRRSKKINWNNILVEMFTENVEIEKCFLELERYQKKICFVAHPSQNRDVYEWKLTSEQKIWEVINEYAAYGGSNGLSCNLVELLNRSDR